jgi:quinol monooxygenase YgiN
MPLYIFARLDPKAGKELQVRDALNLVIEPTRAEPGCTRIHLFESTRDPLVFFIHSEWVDEAAFDAHIELPHTQRFIGAVADLLTNPLHAVRTLQVT